jgi:hypothetical protein
MEIGRISEPPGSPPLLSLGESAKFQPVVKKTPFSVMRRIIARTIAGELPQMQPVVAPHYQAELQSG